MSWLSETGKGLCLVQGVVLDSPLRIVVLPARLRRSGVTVVESLETWAKSGATENEDFPRMPCVSRGRRGIDKEGTYKA